MNSLEHVGALVPMVRYDDRYATAIAKWVLNAANASRFYYPAFLDDEMQDNETWAEQYDPKSAIAYESLREKPDGPYGTGDAMNGGWAQTNLGLYGSSHVGIFGAIIGTTNVEGILQLDLLATDYYNQPAFPTYLFYNPFDEEKFVEVNFHDAVFDLYDAVSNQVILSNATDLVEIGVAAKTSVMLVIMPANSEVTYELDHALVDGTVIDFHSGQPVTNYPPRIKALVAEDSVAVADSQINVYCTAIDRETSDLIYEWWVDGTETEAGPILEWVVPVETGMYQISCRVTDEGGLMASDTLWLKVVEKINYPPVIEALVAEERIIDLNGTTSVSCLASDENGDPLTYTWEAGEGTIEGSGNSITYSAPASDANVYIVCEVTDSEMASDKDSLLVLVRDPSSGQTGELVAHYEFNGNANDISSNNHHGSVSNCIYVEDMHAVDEHAIRFNISSSKVSVPNDDQLNFQDGLTVSYWISVEEFYDRESYPVSHGNWTTRWKTSLTEQRLRFTVNGSAGIVDVDSEKMLETDTWMHVVGLYNGQDCLLFLDGELSGFKPFEGQINKTPYDLVFGQSLPDQSGFNFRGKMDKLRIYNYGISYEEVKEIYTSELSTIGDHSMGFDRLHIYPNPAKDFVWIAGHAAPSENIRIIISNLTGAVMQEIDTRADAEGYIQTGIATGDYDAGIYIVTLLGEKATLSRKFALVK
jgi:hypothetical protein